MNQIKIGKFIAECRKKNNLTQAQLADKLNITDRAVSKWENGKGMPDSSIMLDLCKELKISVNDLLCGEMVDMESKNKNQEQLLLDLTKEIEEKNKIIWTSRNIIIFFPMIYLFSGVFVAESLILNEVWHTVTILGICIVLFILCFYILKLEVSVGTYKCKKCSHEIVPSYFEALCAKHIGTTRYLKCPKCNKKSWHKKILHK